MKGLIAIAVLVGLAFLGTTFVGPGNGMGYFLAIPSAVLAIWLTLCLFGSIWNHMDNLSELHASGSLVRAAETKLEQVKALAADQAGLPEKLLALQQDNSPVTTYMSLVNRAMSDVENRKRSQANIEGKIASRAVGPFSIVVKVFGSTA